MNPAIFPILIAIAVIAVIFFSYYFSSKETIKRSLAKLPFGNVTNIRTNELTKLYGKALHVKEPLIAPYSERECIFYQIKIQQRVSTGKSTRWKTLVEEEVMQEFFLENNGDMVIVKPIKSPRNYNCYLVKDQKQKSGTFNEASPKFKQVLNRYNIDPTNWLGFNKTLRYEEGVIEIGEPIVVAGTARWKSLNEPIPEYPYSKIAELESDAKQKLIITDLPDRFPKR